MSKWLEEREDGSLAFFIDGDLQFDSRDERIYHEAIALPALALALKNKPSLGAQSSLEAQTSLGRGRPAASGNKARERCIIGGGRWIERPRTPQISRSRTC